MSVMKATCLKRPNFRQKQTNKQHNTGYQVSQAKKESTKAVKVFSRN